MTEPIETGLTMELQPPDIARLVDALRAYHALYSPLFQRREQREGAEKSRPGLRLEMPRQALAPMVWALEGAHGNAVRTLPLCSSAGTGEDEALLRRHGQAVDQALGDDAGGLPLDGSDLLQQGQASVGVKRQYCGAVGQRAHGQAGGGVGDARRTGYTLVERRLSWPQAWLEDETYAERRRRGGVPADSAFKTTPRWGWEMSHAVHHAGPWRGRWGTCEEALGRDTACLAQLAGRGWWYGAAGPPDTPGWRQRPAPAGPVWVGRGRQPTRGRGVEDALAAHTVAAVAEEGPAAQWSRPTRQEGRKGPLVADCAPGRVTAMREGWPGPEVWRGRRRNAPPGEWKTSVRKAPADTALTTLVRWSGMRWPMETCGEDSKQYLGMGEYEGRSWRGGHHHLTLCLLAHGVLGRRRLRLKKKAPGLTRPQVPLLLIGMLPTRTFEAQWGREVIAYGQQRNHAAYVSHRKRRSALLSQGG